MGYYAFGNGSAKFLKMNSDKLLHLLDSLKTFNNFTYDVYNDEIWFEEDNSHWDESNTYKFLNTLSPYISSGSIQYSGEEDCIWRYVFCPNDNIWKEECGTIDYNFESYNDEELIAELTKRGYIITRK